MDTGPPIWWRPVAFLVTILDTAGQKRQVQNVQQAIEGDNVTAPGPLEKNQGVGKVYLVGAGPGDSGLLTVRGQQLLGQADVVLYDGLVNPMLLHHSKAQAVRTCRAASGGDRSMIQSEINQQLIAEAKAGKIVVRLKGGDPFIFGRGSEEAAALAAEGIPFEVVPGVTAATAAAVYAGMSLTHRDHASAVAFITGHEDPSRAESSLDYGALAKFPGTLVFYMGLNRLETISAMLMQHGKSPATPAITISRATTPRQKSVVGVLSNIANQVKQASLHAPSLTIIGDCVQLREKVAWFENRPLLGITIGIARSESQLDETLYQAEKYGALGVPLSAIQITSVADWTTVDERLKNIADYEWLVFTSVNAVQAFLGRLEHVGKDLRHLGHLKIAAIGPATARALKDWHLCPDVIPSEYRGENLGLSLAPLVRGKNVLWPRANRGRDILPQILKAAGAQCDEIVVYQNSDSVTLPGRSLAMLEEGELDWVVLSSPSIARNFVRLLSDKARSMLNSRTKVCSISPVTSAAARETGIEIDAEAKVYTWEGIFQTIAQRTAADQPQFE